VSADNAKTRCQPLLLAPYHQGSFKPGDRVLGIDGEQLDGRRLAGVIQPADTHVFTVERDGELGRQLLQRASEQSVGQAAPKSLASQEGGPTGGAEATATTSPLPDAGEVDQARELDDAARVGDLDDAARAIQNAYRSNEAEKAVLMNARARNKALANSGAGNQLTQPGLWTRIGICSACEPDPEAPKPAGPAACAIM